MICSWQDAHMYLWYVGPDTWCVTWILLVPILAQWCITFIIWVCFTPSVCAWFVWFQLTVHWPCEVWMKSYPFWASWCILSCGTYYDSDGRIQEDVCSSVQDWVVCLSHSLFFKGMSWQDVFFASWTGLERFFVILACCLCVVDWTYVKACMYDESVLALECVLLCILSKYYLPIALWKQCRSPT